jgi:hypothetical protein
VVPAEKNITIWLIGSVFTRIFASNIGQDVSQFLS